MMMGLITVMFMATSFGEKEIGLKDEVLIPTLLIIQLVGMLGAWLFARLSGKIGNLKSLIISLIAWTLICYGALLYNRCDRIYHHCLFYWSRNGWFAGIGAFNLLKNAS